MTVRSLISIIVLGVILLRALTVVGSDIAVTANLNEPFKLRPGQKASIKDNNRRIILTLHDFSFTPDGIAYGLDVNFDITLDGVVYAKGSRASWFMGLPYDFKIASDNETYIEFTVSDSIQVCASTEDSILPNGLKAYNKDACWSQLAKRLRNVEYCEKIPHGTGRDGCIEYLIDETSREDLCARVDVPKMYCKYKQAVKDINPDMCSETIRWDYKNQCYKEIAAIKGPSICENLKKTSEITICKGALN